MAKEHFTDAVLMKNPEKWESWINYIKKLIIQHPKNKLLTITKDDPLWPQDQYGYPVKTKEFVDLLESEVGLEIRSTDYTLKIKTNKKFSSLRFSVWLFLGFVAVGALSLILLVALRVISGPTPIVKALFNIWGYRILPILFVADILICGLYYVTQKKVIKTQKTNLLGKSKELEVKGND